MYQVSTTNLEAGCLKTFLE